jgi:hypothetical protein
MRRSTPCVELAGPRRPLVNGAGTALTLASLALIIAACRGVGQPRPSATPTANGLISEQAAIESALAIAMSSRPEISASQVLPREIVATQMTLAEAVRAAFSREAGIPAGYQADRLVWVVTMEGWWTDQFPRPTDSPTPPPYRNLILILDAATGQEIEIRLVK